MSSQVVYAGRSLIGGLLLDLVRPKAKYIEVKLLRATRQRQ